MNPKALQSRRDLNKRVLYLVAAMIPTAIIWDVLNGVSFDSMVRLGIDVVIGGLVLFEIRHGFRTHVFTQVTAVAYATVSIIDTIFGSHISRFDPGVTLALIAMLTVIHVATRPKSQKSTVFLLSLTGIWAIGTVVFGDAAPVQELGLLLLAIPGAIVVVSAIQHLIRDFADASETEATRARIQEAVASCSRALLVRDTDQPLTASLEALLGATEADYAYVDVNRVNHSGETIWEIVAEALVPDNVPENWSNAWMSGDYAGLGTAEALLRSGKPAKILVSELSGPIRAAYEKEGVTAELNAPIFIGERWIGTIGYTDYNRCGNWSEIEVDGLMRAAEMVGAYWEREAAREGLMELAQAKDRFIATVSHELRTPLSAVVGFASELKKGRRDFSREEIDEIAGLIFSQSMEVSQLVDDLLTAERAASGNLTIKPSEFSLKKECRDIVDWTDDESAVQVTGDDATVTGDPLRTRQVLRNLLTNAMRYGGDTIEIEVSSTDDLAVVGVRDNGSGVRTGDVERIFEPYVRALGKNSKPDSVGLGLSVARQLARLMGGDIEYKRSDGWTVFQFTLPLADPTGSPEGRSGTERARALLEEAQIAEVVENLEGERGIRVSAGEK